MDDAGSVCRREAFAGLLERIEDLLERFGGFQPAVER